MLEEVRFLLNFKMDSLSPMALILVGQNELMDKLKLKVYGAIRQRIDLQCKLPHLDRAQVGEYIKRHLTYAGANHEIFSDAAVDEVYRLDVYKRQDDARQHVHSAQQALHWFIRELKDVNPHLQTDITIDIGGFATFADYFFDGLITVSYTHLDVYKRQPGGRPGKCGLRLLRKCLLLLPTDWSKKRDGLWRL